MTSDSAAEPPAGENPLQGTTPGGWDRLIEAVNPASLLVVIDAGMGEALRRHYTAEDVLQETLLHAWRDREQCEWRGLPSFRRWVLRIVDHRLHDLADRIAAGKRGGGRPDLDLAALRGPGASESQVSQWAGPSVTTTPSRAAMAREQADAMRASLDGLPDELRDVVRLRLFHDLPMADVAERVGIGASAAAHRFRKGAGLYHRRLREVLGQ